MSKKEIERLIAEIRKKQEAGELPSLTPEQVQRLEDLRAINKADKDEQKKFAARGYRFGTVAEGWDALRSIPAALKAGKYPDMTTLNWLAAAVERCNENDARQLIRELGLFIHGRHRIVDPEEIAVRIEELKKGGSSVMAACEIAAEEFGCATKTAYRWHRTYITSKK